MVRRRRNQPKIEVELFPFLSILACTIGTLILLIIVITVQTFSDEREVTIIAKSENGENQSKTPRYLECRNDGVVIYPTQTFVPISDIERIGSPFQQLLSEVSENRDKEYLIVAIRPDGIEVFQEVRELIEDQGIDIGYEPIDEGWKLKIQESQLEQI